MKKKYLLYIEFIIFMFLGFSVFAQNNNNSTQPTLTTEDLQNAMLARSSAEYRVTPGDVYTLAYAAGITPVSYIITVDSSYRIRVSNLGIVNGAGKTFMQLKNEVETVVSNNYPLSGVQLVLTQPAIFRVYVNGEVQTAGEIPAWGLDRLSTLLSNISVPNNSNINKYTSIRDISIKSSNGQTRVYDLFKAQRLGDISQDPYLRPGDVITFNKVKRVITINGEVRRPGTYQLQEGENIKELIEFYGGGFTSLADSTRLEMIRIVNSADIAGDKVFLTENDFAGNYILKDQDVITIPAISQLKSVMFVEGAVRGTSLIGSTNTISDVSGANASNRMVIQFNKGETYTSLVRKNNSWFTAVSDTQNAYIIRENERIPINLDLMLYDVSFHDEVLIKESDTLIVPFRQYFITVAGAVARPGRYPYIHDRDWEYYIALAGGFIMERNARGSIKITDMKGNRLKKTDAITPETVITANTNQFLYYFNQYAPVVTTILTIISTILAVQAYTK